ncbi:MAG: hypothetical protein J5637_07115 [Prevotella sp.]|nr:hypothetical protein [Prevotella sp.]
MENKRSLIEKLIVVIAWMVLIGGIMFGTLVSKGIWESQMDMAFPQAVATFVGSIGGSVVAWAILIQIVKMSDRLRRIEEKLQKDNA